MWDWLMNWEIEFGEFKILCYSLDKFMNNFYVKIDEL